MILANSYNQSQMISFGVSNTLDRKLKTISSYHSDTRNDSDTCLSPTRNHSNSLERKKGHLRYQRDKRDTFDDDKSITPTCQTSTFQSLICKTFSSSGSTSKRPLSQDTILENPNVIIAEKNENEFNENKFTDSNCLKRIDQKEFAERIQLKEMEVKNLKIELENANSCIHALKNQLDSNVSLI